MVDSSQPGSALATPRRLVALALLLMAGAALPACGSCDGSPSSASAEVQLEAAGPNATASARADDPVVATVAGQPIYRSSVEDELQRSLEVRARVGRPPGEGWRSRKRRQILEGLIDRLLLERAIADRGIAVDDEAVDARIGQNVERTFKTEQGLRSYLDKVGKSEAAYREDVRFTLAVERLLDLADIEPSEEEIRAFYDANQPRFTARARVKLSTIVLRVPADVTPQQLHAIKTRAVAIARSARQGEAAFADLARKHSEGPTAARGGALGWSYRRDLEDAIAIRAFQLPIGAVSEPIRTRIGYQILSIADRKEAGVRDFEEVRDLIARRLRHRREAAARAKLLADLRRTYKVQTPAP